MPVHAQEDIKVCVDGNYVTFDVPPQVIDGRTMVPIRAIFEAMDATVLWNQSTQAAICVKGDTIVRVAVGDSAITVDGTLTQMDVAPAVIDGRILIPARYVAESLGYTVHWDGDNRVVNIKSVNGSNNSESVTVNKFQQFKSYLSDKYSVQLSDEGFYVCDISVADSNVSVYWKDDDETIYLFDQSGGHEYLVFFTIEDVSFKFYYNNDYGHSGEGSFVKSLMNNEINQVGLRFSSDDGEVITQEVIVTMEKLCAVSLKVMLLSLGIALDDTPMSLADLGFTNFSVGEMPTAQQSSVINYPNSSVPSFTYYTGVQPYESGNNRYYYNSSDVLHRDYQNYIENVLPSNGFTLVDHIPYNTITGDPFEQYVFSKGGVSVEITTMEILDIRRIIISIE